MTLRPALAYTKAEVTEMLYFFECEEGFVPDNGQNDVTNGSVENFPPDAPVPEELPEDSQN